MIKNDPLVRVLYIDLSKKSFKIEERPDIFERFLGGSGAAIQLLHENCPEGIDPLDPANPIILCVGPLTGVFPLASKTVAMFKSPHTGNLGESHAGGRSAIAVRMAGYGAIVIQGASDIPIYLSINEKGVRFRDASILWGMKSSFTPGRVIREAEKGAGYRSIMRIGRGGENMITYASVTCETYRHFGRLGLGALWGSKKLKAIIVDGKRQIDVNGSKEYRKLYKQIYNTAVEMPVMKKYHELGTAENLIKLNAIKALPTRNLQQAFFEDIHKISGETMASQYLGRRLACAHCPVACIHLANVREEYKQDAYFYKTTSVGYDFELIYALGTMLGISDANAMLKLIECVENAGIDAMSTGVILAWTTEMFLNNTISAKELGAVSPDWGRADDFIRMVEGIINRESDFYKDLGKGIDHASNIYGGKEFALTYGKNEMPGYHTGPAAHLGYLLGARHSHLDNAGYSIDQKEKKATLITPEEVVDQIIEEESFRQILSSLLICFFARGIYNMDVIEKCLGIMGYNMDQKEIKNMGIEIYKAKYRFKFREGFDFKKQSFAERIFQTEGPDGIISKEYVEKGLKYADKKIGRLVKE
jgi:aldehyde:ferredoxin oxidoreductase